MSAETENLTSANESKTIIKYQVRLSGLPITEQLAMAGQFVREQNKKILLGKSCAIEIKQNCQKITDASSLGRTCSSDSARIFPFRFLLSLLFSIRLMLI